VEPDQAALAAGDAERAVEVLGLGRAVQQQPDDVADGYPVALPAARALSGDAGLVGCCEQPLRIVHGSRH